MSVSVKNRIMAAIASLPKVRVIDDSLRLNSFAPVLELVAVELEFQTMHFRCSGEDVYLWVPQFYTQESIKDTPLMWVNPLSVRNLSWLPVGRRVSSVHKVTQRTLVPQVGSDEHRPITDEFVTFLDDVTHGKQLLKIGVVTDTATNNSGPRQPYIRFIEEHLFDWKECNL